MIRKLGTLCYVTINISKILEDVRIKIKIVIISIVKKQTFIITSLGNKCFKKY